MRLVHKLTAKGSEDLDQLQQFLDQCLSLDDTVITTQSCGRRTIAPSATEIEFEFGGVTNAKYVIIFAYDHIQYQFNSITDTLVDLKPEPATVASPVSNIQKEDAPGRLFLGPTDITALFVTNPSITDAASYFVAVIGEAS